MCNVRDSSTTCNITAAVILPDNDIYEMSWSKILPWLEAARQQVIDDNLLPPNVNLTFLPMDDRCSNIFSILKAQRAYSMCAHVFFGPSCEYALGEYLDIFTLRSDSPSLRCWHRCWAITG
jgi:atrial natriuretic peptide receptor A